MPNNADACALTSATLLELKKIKFCHVLGVSTAKTGASQELNVEFPKQYEVYCPDEASKISVIKDRILKYREHVNRTIIFVNSTRSSFMLQIALCKPGFKVGNINMAMKLKVRDGIAKHFNDGVTPVLIANGVLARGIEQRQFDLVINFDLPVIRRTPSQRDYQVYLQRIAFAGRSSSKGVVFNLLTTEEDKMTMRKIEGYFENEVGEVRPWNIEFTLKEAGLIAEKI